MDYGFIYMTINHINGMKYIGRLKRQNPDYDEKCLGSSSSLNEDIQRFGRNNFSKVILKECKDEESLWEAESYYFELYDVGLSKDFYNKMSSPSPGFRSGDNHHMNLPENRKKIAEISRVRFSGPDNPMKNPLVANKFRGDLSPSRRPDQIERMKVDNPMNITENRLKVSNSKLGRIWINNGSDMKFVYKEEFENKLEYLNFKLGMIKRRKY